MDRPHRYRSDLDTCSMTVGELLALVANDAWNGDNWSEETIDVVTVELERRIEG